MRRDSGLPRMLVKQVPSYSLMSHRNLPGLGSSCIFSIKHLCFAQRGYLLQLEMQLLVGAVSVVTCRLVLVRRRKNPLVSHILMRIFYLEELRLFF